MISIITINKNNATGLKRSIESVLDQTYGQVDFIVIDGDSTDGSKEVLEAFKGKISTAVSEPDSGIYNAMNKGIRLSKGDYLLFLNSGDYLLNKDVLARVAPKLKTADVVSGDIMIEDNNDIVHRMASQDKISWRWFSHMSLYHQATFVSKRAFDTYGLYDESFKLGGDYEFFLRLFFRHKASYRHIHEFISYFKTDGISNTASYLELNRQEARRARGMHVSKARQAGLNSQLAFKKNVNRLHRFINRLLNR